MAGVVSIPWYATLFRGDRFAEALGEIAPLATRYGATDYRVYRNRDDMYRFNQMATFESKGRGEMIALLLEHGAHLEAANKDKQTAWLMAAMGNQLEVVEIFKAYRQRARRNLEAQAEIHVAG